MTTSSNEGDTIAKPQPSHPATHHSTPREATIATELDSYTNIGTPEIRQRNSSAFNTAGTQQANSLARVIGVNAKASGGRKGEWREGMRLFWGRHVSLRVAPEGCRDHLDILFLSTTPRSFPVPFININRNPTDFTSISLTALERTYLSYLRTSLALANTGVIVAQLFRLQNNSTPYQLFSFFNAGKPLAGLFIACGMIVCLLGGWRFWRQQNALVGGKIHASGWEIAVVGGVIAVLAFVLFALVVGIDVDDEVTGND